MNPFFKYDSAKNILLAIKKEKLKPNFLFTKLKIEYLRSNVKLIDQ